MKKFNYLAAASAVLFSSVLTFNDSNAENLFTSAAYKTGSSTLKVAKAITPDSFFIEGYRMQASGGLRTIANYSLDSTYANIDEQASGNSTAIRAGVGYDLGKAPSLQISYFNYSHSNGDNMDGKFYNFNGMGNSDNAIGYRDKYNVKTLDINLVQGKTVTNNLNLQFSGGLKYVDFKRNFNSYGKSQFDDSNHHDDDYVDSQSSFKAFGPQVGMGADYKVIGGFSVFGNANAAIVSGISRVIETITEDNYFSNASHNYSSNQFRSKERLITPIIAGDFGIKWAKDKIFKNTGVAIKLGYHLESWQSVIKNPVFNSDSWAYDKVNSQNLSLSGAYLRTTFSF